MIRVENLTKIFSNKEIKVTALKKINLSINKGEFVSIIGPSGSGKSTFLLTLGGLVHPDDGKIYIDYQSIYELTVDERAKIRRHTLGFMFQTFNLIPYLTVIENVQVPLCIIGKSEKDQTDISTELLIKFGLKDRMFHKPSELSVGECQRTALARALANNPALILADEPTGNLDPDCSEKIFNYFNQLNQKGMTIVVVTHDHNAAKFAKRQFEIINGEIN